MKFPFASTFHSAVPILLYFVNLLADSIKNPPSFVAAINLLVFITCESEAIS